MTFAIDRKKLIEKLRASRYETTSTVEAINSASDRGDVDDVRYFLGDLSYREGHNAAMREVLRWLGEEL